MIDSENGKEAESIEEFEEKEEEIRKPLIEVRNLKTYFFTEEGIVKAVDGVSFDIYKNEVLGLVGETGCGKSVTALSILGLVRAPGKIMEGTISLNGKNLVGLSRKEMRNYRGNKITMIFQDPLNSLNPVMTVGNQIGEVFLLHQKDRIKGVLQERRETRRVRMKEVRELQKKLKDEAERLNTEEINEINEKIESIKEKMKGAITIKTIVLEEAEKIVNEVGIADAKGILKRYPHELSGGMRQRVMIAMALTCNPVLLCADEPTTALDVTIQAQILDLMKDLKDRFQTSILMITHDLGIIADLCDRVAVMYSGNIVEYATAVELFKKPKHPYTQGLIGAIPSIEKRDQKLKTIRGMVPNLIYPPSGCRFHPRCDFRLEVCDKVKPRFLEIADKYYIACHLYDPEYKDSPKYEWEEEEFELSGKV
ncbi:MAG: ABC transporter ATP-binding protein [Candidatus Lokiarchaeota archaeon]|nr:ABC transporter ATP-binding protein [Candidatus Lokiarchaeota archaeon]